MHHGIGWKEIFKDLFQFKKPILGAENEYLAIKLLESVDVSTMRCAAYGKRGMDPSRQESFLVTEELAGMISLEDFVKNALFSGVRKDILSALAVQLGVMHRSGLNHRDCYICHFMLDPEKALAGDVKLHVIDLHRAQIRQKVPFRYLVKDVAGILFSSADLKISRMEMLRFIRLYSNRPLAVELKENGKFWESVAGAARKLYFKEFGREMPF